MSPIRILLIEGGEEETSRLRRCLAGDGLGPCVLNYAHCLAAALKRLSHGGVEIVLMDAELPDSRGIEGVLKVRAAAPGVPLVVLIHPEERELARRAAESGVPDCLLKGHLDGPALISAVKYAVASTRVAAARREEG